MTIQYHKNLYLIPPPQSSSIQYEGPTYCREKYLEPRSSMKVCESSSGCHTVWDPTL